MHTQHWERIVRGLGLGCAIAGVARMGMTPTSMIWGFNSVPELACGLAACMLMAFFSFGLYFAQSRETGVLGGITIGAIMLGNLLTACVLWGYLVYGGFGDENHALNNASGMVSSAGVLGGTLALAILTWRAKVFPRAAVFGLLGMLASMALPWTEWFAFFWGLSYVIMGYCMWSGKLAKRPASPSAGISA
ncbi:hypothetical protein [Paenibacillus sp.]|uniref:hypothetical protein n=1 Tax=Paenibacillus sp. TaxID=58172 RepID=UPI0028124D91|nr:hypothetical protein [Paenibacillus sp.]